MLKYFIFIVYPNCLTSKEINNNSDKNFKKDYSLYKNKIIIIK